VRALNNFILRTPK